jgi:hypothetical protein
MLESCAHDHNVEFQSGQFSVACNCKYIIIIIIIIVVVVIIIIIITIIITDIIILLRRIYVYYLNRDTLDFVEHDPNS